MLDLSGDVLIRRRIPGRAEHIACSLILVCTSADRFGNGPESASRESALTVTAAKFISLAILEIETVADAAFIRTLVESGLT